MPLQKDFWKGVLKELPESGTRGKVVLQEQYAATITRLQGDGGIVNLQVSA
jgi:hypothetical protein